MGAVAAILLLAVPAGHQVIGHRLLRPGRARTPHELRHAARPRSLRLLADVAWILYLAGAVSVAVLLR